MGYIATDTDGVVKETVTHEKEVNLDNLIRDLKHIKGVLKEIPRPKTKPDQETLDFWNKHHKSSVDPSPYVSKANDILVKLREIHNEGLLPERLVDPLLNFGQWLKQFE